MSKKIDLTGQQFGRLVVISEAPAQNGRTMWHCRCECGKENLCASYNLRSGKIISCGCAHGSKTKGTHIGEHLDITGQRFGQLTALEFIRRDYWLFRCDCGREKRIRASSVKRGKVVSCGHVLSEVAMNKIARDNVVGFCDGTSLSILHATLDGRIKARSSNSTGIVGVSAVRRKNGYRFAARLMLRGKEIHLGTYDTIEEAAAARKAGEQQYYAPVVDRHKDASPGV